MSRVAQIVPLLLAVTIVGSNGLVLGPIAAHVALSFDGVQAADVMTASALCGLGTAMGALFLAPRADAFGLARALRLAMAGLAGGLLCSVLSPSLWVLCAAQLLAGISAGLALPAIYGLAAEIAPPGRERQTLGYVLLGWTLSLVGGVSLSAVAVDLVNWRAVYAVMSALALIVLTVLPKGGATPSKGNADGGVLAALRVRGAVRALFGCAAYMTAFYGLYGFLGIHLQEDLGLPSAHTGFATLAYGAGFSAAIPLDRYLDRYDGRTAACVVFPALAAIYLLLALAAPHAPVLIALCGLWGVANHLGLNLIVSGISALDPARRAALMGLYSAVTYLAVFAGTLAYHGLYVTQGFAAGCVVSGLLAVAAILGQGKPAAAAAASLPDSRQG